jgi:hypothetical protein
MSLQFNVIFFILLLILDDLRVVRELLPLVFALGSLFLSLSDSILQFLLLLDSAFLLLFYLHLLLFIVGNLLNHIYEGDDGFIFDSLDLICLLIVLNSDMGEELFGSLLVSCIITIKFFHANDTTP